MSQSTFLRQNARSLSLLILERCPFQYWYVAILGMVIVLTGGGCLLARAQTSEWVWVGGSQTAYAGIYGTQGVPAARNIPGARRDAFTWTDASGNLWLFGGEGLNDLWEHNPSTNMWTWVGGSNTANAAAVYGAQGVPSRTNIPGPRNSGVAWTDKEGNLWLFGGSGTDSRGQGGLLNDLWKYNPFTQEWTWVSGSNTVNSSGVYGTQGVASATNIPSARYGEDSGGILPGWTDNDGNFWFFGGKGYDSAGSVDSLNDLWEYSPRSGMWTWVSGSKTVDGTGVYGTQGIARAGNTPSARQSAQAWKDMNGNFWLHGGYANDVKCSASPSNMCADSPEMWEFNPITKEWTWISGQDSANAPPVYGTQGVASDLSNPGGREMTATWADPLGNLWLFSGYAFDGQNDNGPTDLWMYNTTTNQWTWEGGNSSYSNAAVYGTLGVPAASNWPESQGIEGSSATWVDAQGNFWLFSGSGNPNDLWVYHASPAATPALSLTGGTYTTTQTVIMSDATPGATIYYTTDGTTPTAKSFAYGGPVIVSATATINAIAIAAGYPTSAVANAAYTITPATANPSFTPASGTYTGSQTVSITDATEGATIYFTTDGSTPATTSAVYGGPITVSSTETINAIAIASGYTTSAIVSAMYTISFPPGFTAGSGGTTSMALASGATTGNTGTISVVGTNGFNGTVNLTCKVTTSMSGVNDMPTCGLNPTSVTVSGTTVQTTTLTVTTTTSRAENQIRNLFWPSAGGTALASLLFFVVPRGRRSWVNAVGLFLLVASTGLIGCGGGNGSSGGGSGSGNTGTTPGAYTITVTGNSGTVSATVGMVTLMVH